MNSSHVTARSDRVARAILDDIGNGSLQADDELPAESSLAERYGVSRLTVREATKNLATRGVLRVQQGRKSRIVPPDRWSALDPDLVAVRSRLPGMGVQLMKDLMEVRLIFEVAAAELAAARITQQELDDLESSLAIMIRDVSAPSHIASTEADMAFHRTIIAAARNEYLRDAYAPLEEVLRTVRLQTSSSSGVRQDAVDWHATILAALASGDATRAAEAMRGHMEQTAGAIAELPNLRTPADHTPKE